MISEIERIKQFETLLQEQPNIDRGVIPRLVEMGFFLAPASSKHHAAYKGGLFSHSCAVAQNLIELTVRNKLTWKRDSSPFIVGMFHDLYKVDQYECVHKVTIDWDDLEETEYETVEYKYNKDTILTGHGEKSIMLLSQLMTLTDEEIACIRYHMGAFTNESEWKYYTTAIQKFPNVLWTHTADMMATHIQGV